jgi:phage N-6-adenine-methyltransferase
MEVFIMNKCMFTSESAEWYTPKYIIDKAIKVLGKIDLDPCAPVNLEDRAVPANTYYTAMDDGLSKSWNGKIFCNPPYGRQIGQWTTKLDSEYHNGNADEAILLVPARVDTKWYDSIADHPVCLVRGRVHFSNCNNSAPFPRALIYFGDDVIGFIEVFSDLGNCMSNVGQTLSYTRQCSICNAEYEAKLDAAGRVKDYYCNACRNAASARYKDTDEFRTNNHECPPSGHPCVSFRLQRGKRI